MDVCWRGNSKSSNQDDNLYANKTVNDMEAPVSADEKVWEEFFHEADGVK